MSPEHLGWYIMVQVGRKRRPQQYLSAGVKGAMATLNGKIQISVVRWKQKVKVGGWRRAWVTFTHGVRRTAAAGRRTGRQCPNRDLRWQTHTPLDSWCTACCRSATECQRPGTGTMEKTQSKRENIQLVS